MKGQVQNSTINRLPVPGTEATIGVLLEKTTGPCTATGASFETTIGPCTATGATGAEGAPASTVSFNVGAPGTADKFFPNWEALASREEVRVNRIILCFREGFEA